MLSTDPRQTFELALAHHQAGRLAEAEHLYRQVLAAVPQNAFATQLLGVIAHQVGRHDIAVAMIRQAIAWNPNHADWHSNLGEAHRSLSQRDEAVAAYRQALALNPNLPEAWSNLGHVLWDKGEFDEAAAACHRAIALRPDFAEAYANLGNVLGDTGHLDEAAAAYRRAIELSPELAKAYSNLGGVLGEMGRFDEAIAAYRRALQIAPDYAAWGNFGDALRERGQLGAAVVACRRAIEFEPADAIACNNLANALVDQGQVEEAIAIFRRAHELKPERADIHSNLLFSLHYLPRFGADALFAEHRRWEEVHAKLRPEVIAPHANTREPGRQLRIGYVSPDFREHPVAAFFEGLLENHDRTQAEIFCYACQPRADHVTARLRLHAAHWRSIHGVADARAAEMIRADRVDILVDLAGHTARNRLPVFAHKPAPVQVTWLGYCDTTGMQAMDFRLTDALADPPGSTEHLHTEQLVRLPDCAWCFRPPDAAPPVVAAPCLASAHVTFGCFNAQPKLNDEIVALWARILLAVPGSRLFLKNRALGEPAVQARILAVFASAGVAPDRIEMLAATQGIAEHLAAYGRVDVALDTFPYHGTTTTCDALWMGVPVVTLAGHAHAGRVGVSLLTNVGLAELIASDADDYVRTAKHLAANPARLADLRATLRDRMARSPLTDAPRFARNVEAAFREMWRKWCADRGAALT